MTQTAVVIEVGDFERPDFAIMDGSNKRLATCKTREAADNVALRYNTQPDLLAALELVDLRLNQVQPGHGTRANDLVDYLRSVVRAAIAKARGQS